MEKHNKLVWRLKNVGKTFRVGTQDVTVLEDITFEITEGNFVLIFGSSGSGKSTLLHAMVGLEPPSIGEVRVFGEDIYSLSEDERAGFRKDNMGMVYQQPLWIKALSVINNVAFPWLLRGESQTFARRKAEEKLALFGMMDWANYLPSELSSGQQQRVSLARALVTDPHVIVADEPTGNLDHESGQYLVNELSRLSDTGKTVIMVSHDLGNLSFCKSAIKMTNGKVVGTYKSKKGGDLLNQIIADGGAYKF